MPRTPLSDLRVEEMNMATQVKQREGQQFGLEFDRTSLPSINMNEHGTAPRDPMPTPKEETLEVIILSLIRQIRSLRKDLKSLEQVTRISRGRRL